MMMNAAMSAVALNSPRPAHFAMRIASRFTFGNGHHAEPEAGGTESDAGSGTAANDGESNSEVPSVTRQASGLTGPVSSLCTEARPLIAANRMRDRDRCRGRWPSKSS